MSDHIIHMILNLRSCDLMIYKYVIIILKSYDHIYMIMIKWGNINTNIE
jgi:hypothetical protein